MCAPRPCRPCGRSSRRPAPRGAGEVGHRHRPAPRPASLAAARRTSHGRRAARSGRARAAPLAPVADDRPPGSGAHAVAESVAGGPPPLVGLECALHLVPPRPRPPRVMSGAGGGNRNDRATNSARRWSTRAGAGTTLEGETPATPTWAPGRAPTVPTITCAHARQAPGAGPGTVVHIQPQGGVPTCGRPWSAAGAGATLRRPPPLGRGARAGEGPTSTGGSTAPEPVGYLASSACAVIHKCGWCCG